LIGEIRDWNVQLCRPIRTGNDTLTRSEQDRRWTPSVNISENRNVLKLGMEITYSGGQCSVVTIHLTPRTTLFSSVCLTSLSLLNNYTSLQQMLCGWILPTEMWHWCWSTLACEGEVQKAVYNNMAW